MEASATARLTFVYPHTTATLYRRLSLQVAKSNDTACTATSILDSESCPVDTIVVWTENSELSLEPTVVWTGNCRLFQRTVTISTPLLVHELAHPKGHFSEKQHERGTRRGQPRYARITES